MNPEEGSLGKYAACGWAVVQLDVVRGDEQSSVVGGKVLVAREMKNFFEVLRLLELAEMFSDNEVWLWMPRGGCPS